MEDYVAEAIVIMFIAGGVCFLGGYFLISYLSAHLTIGWV